MRHRQNQADTKGTEQRLFMITRRSRCHLGPQASDSSGTAATGAEFPGDNCTFVCVET